MYDSSIVVVQYLITNRSIIILCVCCQDLQAADERRVAELRQKDEEIRQKNVQINRVQVYCVVLLFSSKLKLHDTL